MHIVTIASRKGGSGKSTIACNLAVQAERCGVATVILDLDPQCSATTWGDWRGAAYPPEVLAAQAPRLDRLITQAKAGGAALVVIDTPPANDGVASAAMRVADLVIIPSRAAALDVAAVLLTAREAMGLAVPTYVVLNAVRSRSPLIAEATDALAAAGIPQVPVTIGERAVFQGVQADGLGVVERESTSLAAGEVEALWSWVASQLEKRNNQ